MLLFVDTEFTDFIDTRLISLGAVTDNGKSFYVEIQNPPLSRCSTFVQNNVIPLLDNHKYGLKEIEASARLFVWLSELEEEVVIVVDHQTDFDLMLDLLETFPSNVQSKPLLLFPLVELLANKCNLSPETCYDVMESKINEYFLAKGKSKHHALYDAEANSYAFQEICSTLFKSVT